MAFASDNGVIELWCVGESFNEVEILANLTGHDDIVQSISVNCDRVKIVSGSLDMRLVKYGATNFTRYMVIMVLIVVIMVMMAAIMKWFSRNGTVVLDDMMVINSGDDGCCLNLVLWWCMIMTVYTVIA